MYVLKNFGAESSGMPEKACGLQYVPMWADKEKAKRLKKIRKLAKKKRASKNRALALVERIGRGL